MGSGKRRRFLETGLLLGAALSVGGLFLASGVTRDGSAPPWLLPLDDAYIFLRYALQAARGEPLQWTSGLFSTGASSFLYPWLEVPAFWISMKISFASRWAFWLGAVALWAAGTGALRLLRSVGAPDPWPLAGGLTLVWFGPMAFASLGGMESGLNGAALLWALAFWVEGSGPRSSPRIRWLALLLVAFLPWIRPENGILTGMAAGALLLGVGPGLPRVSALLVFLPGAVLAGTNWLLTGHLSPAGALAKSRLTAPFVGPELQASLFLHDLWERVLPVYAGSPRFVLPPPVGWLAVAGALLAFASLTPWRPDGTSIRWRRVVPVATAWSVLVVLAPFSSLVHWHYWRHHHGGLALGWVLALGALAALFESVDRDRLPRLRWLALVVPLALALSLPGWASRFARGVEVLHRRDGKGAGLLEELPGDRVLLLDDAGLLSLAYDGPMIDVVGLGTPGLALPFRH
ncbi:MAG: hypothetical protein R3234_12590, partial [Thermoanaerobaculia bacterium]|nr:hypothetical protein [Thermoanaerobaculia bacterium]